MLFICPRSGGNPDDQVNSANTQTSTHQSGANSGDGHVQTEVAVSRLVTTNGRALSNLNTPPAGANPTADFSAKTLVTLQKMPKRVLETPESTPPARDIPTAETSSETQPRTEMDSAGVQQETDQPVLETPDTGTHVKGRASASLIAVKDVLLSLPGCEGLWPAFQKRKILKLGALSTITVAIACTSCTRRRALHEGAATNTTYRSHRKIPLPLLSAGYIRCCCFMVCARPCCYLASSFPYAPFPSYTKPICPPPPSPSPSLSLFALSFPSFDLPVFYVCPFVFIA